MSAGLILTFVIVTGLLYVMGKSCWKPLFFLFNWLFQGALGGFGIYLANLLLNSWQISIPLNPYNSLVVGLLGLPGMGMLLVLKYWIKI